MKTFYKLILIFLVTLTVSSVSFAQDGPQNTPLQISGSGDLYYKYDFSNFKTLSGSSNIPTSFATDHNSVSLGMLNVILKKSAGKTSFVGDISFGPRGQYQSIPTGDVGNTSNSFHIQNLYATYKFNDAFSMTAGYMGTFVGYEVISPVANFNYSTSYLFTNGPFQNAGIKANFAFSDKVGLMVGLFNDWNTFQDINGVSHVGAQLSVIPAEGWTAYFNVLSGRGGGGAATYGSGTILDLTTTYQLAEGFRLGLNLADYSLPEDNGGYSGLALYPQFTLSSRFGLGARGEYFKFKDAGGVEGSAISSLTLTGNIKTGSLTIIPELRFDNNDSSPFFNNNVNAARSASQFLIAAVYAF
ncbi:porin [Daejeonella sp.]|uniref:porin n=1 Tax=Daejeonella sp. TaxID=2805397 RepID=UPI003982EB2C